MARLRSYNPVAFTPWPVTVFCTLVYLAVLVPLLVVHFTVPEPPSNTPLAGINLTEAWLDLKTLTDGVHPYNSRRNDEVRNWILQRLDAILAENGVSPVESHYGGSVVYSSPASEAVVFNDMLSNLTYTADVLSSSGITTYFEGTNIIVYVRGFEDEDGPWWTQRRLHGQGGVLVNAHYDSVSTGFGATDDGMGVVSILQLVKHFTAAVNKPRRGLVALFNNGEEDYLNGASAFARHPVSRFPRTFLNLEGAGAGGRAALFRSTDAEVTSSYRGTKHPFGTVVSGDAFQRGFVRSQTDYIVFNDRLGMRGLDVAFMEPRARYHTDQDDARHASVSSLWHMLSVAVHTTRGLTDSTFEKDEGSSGVWFDLFGSSFILLQLRTLFALSVTLLVVAPLVLIATAVVLVQVDKFYLFSYSKTISSVSGDESVSIKGMRGFFRFPFIFLIPSAAAVGLALLMNKVNPFITYSSPYAVWSTMLSAWLFCAWFLARFADFARPSAFHRTYSWLWMFVLSWALLVANTVFEDHLQIASGYIFVWNFLAVSLATWIGLLELFGLEKKTAFAEKTLQGSSDVERPQSNSGRKNGGDNVAGSSRQATSADNEAQEEDAIEDDVNEGTSLLRGQRTSFANYSSRSRDLETNEEVDSADKSPAPYPFEQEWSANLPSWTWLLQLLIAAPVTVILTGQIALFLTSAAYQTPADGNPALTVYLIIAIFSILVLSPLTPFLHRYTYHIPTFLLFVCAGTLIYNLTAFPFSANNRLKFYFIQRVDLDTGLNEVGISSVGSSYADLIVGSLPSSAGKAISIQRSPKYPELVEYSWAGLPPQVVPPPPHLPPPDSFPPDDGPLLPPVQPGYYSHWLTFNATRTDGTGELASHSARFSVSGRNTRNCRIYFNKPVREIHVSGSSDPDPRFPTVAEQGAQELRLWSRDWENTWVVDVSWDNNFSDGKDRSGSGEGMDGRVSCLWNDEDGKQGVVPALEELRRFMPTWAAVTKLADGLVEGSKAFLV